MPLERQKENVVTCYILRSRVELETSPERKDCEGSVITTRLSQLDHFIKPFQTVPYLLVSKLIRNSSSGRAET